MLEKLISLLKNNRFIWFPLSMLIFITYALQRGLASFAKTDMVVPWLQDGMGIYFTTMSLTVLLGGFILDKVSSKVVILFATGVGILGILGLIHGPWLFGIGFGIAASFVKLAPYSAPLKLFDGNDGIRISPQASAKNFGGAFFLLFFGAFLMTFTFNVIVVYLSLLFAIIGLLSYYMLPDDKIKGWNIIEIKEVIKKWKFWVLMSYFFIMCGVYYVAIMGFFPAMIKIGGYTKGETITLMAISFILAGILRWPAAWIGQKIGYWKTIIIGTIGMIITIPLTKIDPLLAMYLFAPFSAIHTPNYWALAKDMFGKKYLGTVIGLGFVAMYIGAGFMYGKW
jgi:hypothetical protein